MPYVTQRQSPAWKHMDPIFCNGSLWPNSSGVVGSLAAWYDSSNTASMLDGSGNPITAGGKVATWKDISGNSPAGEHDLLQGTDANRPIYLPWSGSNYGWLNGVSGNYFSTPSAAALQLGATFSLVWEGTLDDWTPSASQILIGKYSTTDSKRQYNLTVTSVGQVTVSVSADGGGVNLTTIGSSVILGLTDRTRKAIRVDYVGSGATARFYTASSRHGPWTELGTEQAGTARTPFSSDTPLLVGGATAGTVQSHSGNTYYAAAIEGTFAAGTVVAEFDASRYTSGPTFTAATGEVWTVNGGAHIVTRTGLYFDGSNDYLKSAAFSLSQPESVYFVGSQVTWTGGDLLLDGNSASERLVVYQYTAGASPQLALTNNAGINGGLALKTSGVLSAVFNSAASSLRVNRTAAVTGNALTASANGVALGTNAIASAPSNIFVSELAIYSAAHSTTIQSRLALGFSRKWRFPV